MKTLIDVLAALGDFVKVASEWAESASKAEVETFTQICPQKEETVKKAVEKPVTLEEVRSVLTKGNGAEIAAKVRRQSIV